MALEHEGGAVAAANPGQQVGTAGLDVVHLDVGAGGAGQVGDVVGQVGLAGAVREAGVDAVDGDQAGERVNDGFSDGHTSHCGATGESGTRRSVRNGGLARNKSFFQKTLEAPRSVFLPRIGDAGGWGERRPGHAAATPSDTADAGASVNLDLSGE